jgi:hypothetical protein
MIEAYRIVEEKGGDYYSLFHGTNGSRKLPRGIWIKANKKIVADGSRKTSTEYESGFHVLTSKDEAEKFFQKLFRKHKNRKVIKVLAKGLRRKEHSRHEIFLADEMMIP